MTTKEKAAYRLMALLDSKRIEMRAEELMEFFMLDWRKEKIKPEEIMEVFMLREKIKE